MAVGVDRQALAGAEVGALGIADARVGLAPGGLGLGGQGDGRFRIQRPGMPGIEFAYLAGHALGIGQAGGGVGLGVAGDGAGLLDRRLQRARLQVGGAGIALALAEVDRDRQAAVAVAFQGFDLAQAHAHRQAQVLVQQHLGLAGAAGPAALQYPLRRRRKPVQALPGIVRWWGRQAHRRILAAFMGGWQCTKKNSRKTGTRAPAAAPSAAMRWRCWRWRGNWSSCRKRCWRASAWTRTCASWCGPRARSPRRSPASGRSSTWPSTC